MESYGTINSTEATKIAMGSDSPIVSPSLGSSPALRRSQSWPPAVCALEDPDAAALSIISESGDPSSTSSAAQLPRAEVHTRRIDLSDTDPQKLWTLFESASAGSSQHGALPDYLALDTMQQGSPSHSFGSRSSKSGSSVSTYSGSDSSRSIVTQVDNMCSALEKRTSFRKAMGEKWFHFMKKSSPSHVKKSLNHYRRRVKERSSLSQDVKEQLGNGEEVVTNSPHELSFSYEDTFADNQADGDSDVDGDPADKTAIEAAYEDSIYPKSETSVKSIEPILDPSSSTTDKSSGTPSPISSSDEAIWATGRESREMASDQRSHKQGKGQTTVRRHLWAVNGHIVYYGGVRRRGRHTPSGKRRAAREPHPLLFDIQEE